MKISIAMTTYNGAKFIAQQLESFCRQTRFPDELIIQDDGSQDNTLALVEEFAETAPFYVNFQKNEKNVGVSENFSIAIHRCSGDLILLSDQDDVWLPNKIAKIEEYFRVNPDVSVIANDALIVDSNLSPEKPSLMKRVKAGRNSENDFVHGCCTAIRKNFAQLLFPQKRLKENSIGYDEYIHLAGRLTKSRMIAEDVLQYYRRHESNVSQSDVYQKNNFYARARYYLNQAKKIRSTPLDKDYISFQAMLLSELLEKDKSLLALESKCRSFAQESLNDLLKRIEIRRSPVIRRFFPVAQNLFSGKYSRANGMKSAASDLIVKYEDSPD